MNDRTCIVLREAGSADALIRFVAGPDGQVVPDLKGKLPGRGCWVTGTRDAVEKALKRKLFARALRAEVKAADDLPDMIEQLLLRNALGALGLARKSGSLVMGAAQVESSVRSAKAYLVLHAREASPDGVRKISNARAAVRHMEGPEITAWKLFGEAELGLALGGTNVIHAAVLGETAGKPVERRLVALHRFRESPDGRQTIQASTPQGSLAAEDAAKDME